MIPYGTQTISEDDIDAVVNVLRSEFLTQGPVVPKFEAAVANYCNCRHAVAVNSATSALHIACLALGVEPGDSVWTSPNSFVASANCALYCGASVDFVEIDPTTFNLSVEYLGDKLRMAEQHGTLPKVVIVVHFAGQPCDMARVKELATIYGFRVIEDASHAIGARYRESIVGDCQYSDITVFSFHPVKIITTAEGGMATTQCPVLARRMQLLRSHGITRESDELNDSQEGAWYYEQQMLGFNYRMTEMQAALGLSQLRHLDDWVKMRHLLADEYDQQFAGAPVETPRREADRYSALHLYCIQVDDRGRVFEGLRHAGIGVNVHYIPIYRHPYYRQFLPRSFHLPNADRFYSRCITLPMHVRLTYDRQAWVIKTVRDLCSRSSAS